jgi:hypothetical protein
MVEIKEEAQESLDMDDGTEGSTLGYLKPGQLESKESEEHSEEGEAGEEEDVDEEEGDEFLDEADEEDSEEDEDQPDELEARRKALEKDFTSKYREISKKRGMIQMMERIQANPEEMIPWLAEQFGVPWSGGAAESKDDGIKLELPDLSGLNPGQDEMMPAYINRVFQQGMKSLMEQLPAAIAKGVGSGTGKPKGRKMPPGFMQESEDPIGDAIKALDNDHEDWPLYEDDMVAVLKEKPELINKPGELYKEGKKRSGLFAKRAVSKAKKAKTKKFATGMRGSGKKRTRKSSRVMNFNDAWERAKVDAIRRK